MPFNVMPLRLRSPPGVRNAEKGPQSPSRTSFNLNSASKRYLRKVLCAIAALLVLYNLLHVGHSSRHPVESSTYGLTLQKPLDAHTGSFLPLEEAEYVCETQK